MVVAEVDGCTRPNPFPAAAGPQENGFPLKLVENIPDSGIYGRMIAAWGNPPTALPPSECIRVLNPGGDVIATGTCSGMFREFRVPLSPGQYVVEMGSHSEMVKGVLRLVPDRKDVEVRPGVWVNIGKRDLPGPVP